jgi:2-methylcitrate dehydratase PrpD
MLDPAVAKTYPTAAGRDAPLTARLGAAIAGKRKDDIPPAARDKVSLCVLDFLACALEAHALPWARQAAALATDGAGPCTIIGTAKTVPATDATFANAVAGHGLVREDMHTGSVSHLGVVVLPPLLALAQEQRVDGRTFAAAAVIGYEVGARVGRALVTPEFTRTFRPTGFTGPLGSAAACSYLLGTDAGGTASALALAANMAGGLNQWPHTGSDDMFFHPGIAARNGLTAARLASLGAHGSEQALDGEAGLLPAYRPDRRAPDIRLFDREPEITSVFFKPVPVCNFAQTPCLAAVEIVTDEQIDCRDITAVNVKTSHAAKAYPGCDYAGPFARVLQAKMSIQHAVASALARGRVDEESYRDLNDATVRELANRVTVEADTGFTNAFPAKQGAEVMITLQNGTTLSRRLADVVPADSALIRRRFRTAAAAVLGAERANALEQAVDGLSESTDVGAIVRLARAASAEAAAA